VDNILPRSYLKDVFPRLTPPPDVALFYEVKADLKSHEMETLARARVIDLQPGIESLSSSTLKLMRKGTTAFQNVGFMKNCVVYGVRPQWNLLIGFPGETSEVYEKYVADIPSLLHLPPPSGAFPVRFDRFSPYFMQAKDYGLDLHPSDFYGFIYPFGEEVMAQMIYYFVDHHYTSVYLATMSQWRDRIQEQVDRWHVRWGRLDQGLAPALFFADQAAGVVHDTRDGALVRHELGALGGRALQALDRPKRAADLAEQLADAGTVDVDALIRDLLDRRLLFTERDLYMSLLLPGQYENRA
jgi:hypothetical protein